MPPQDLLTSLHAAVNCYLSALEATAHALAEACPPIGKPYGQRLSRLRARLAFDSSAGKIEESCAVTAQELKDYAERAAAYVEQNRAELRRTVTLLEEMVRAQAQRQEFYGERLRRLAKQMEKPGESAGVPAAGLLSCVESMSHESQSRLKKMRDEMAQMETRLAGIEITDPVTGLLNRREMERLIAAAKARGETPVLLRFECRQGFPGADPPGENLPHEVARQVGERLGSQFRHNDLISRWSERQFLVLFKGREQTARMRGEQILPWIAGPYQLDDGTAMEVAAQVWLVDHAGMVEAELAAAHT
jgi:GGDEF domain-containing protein